MSQKIDFLLEYEVKNRELESLCLVAAYLRKKGYSVGFVNSWQSLYEGQAKYKAKVLVVSACYDDGTYNYFTTLADSYDKVVNMQWEQVVQNNHYLLPAEQANVPYSGIGLRTRHVCWGEKERRWLIEHFGVQEDCPKVVGYVPADFYRPELQSSFIPREELFTRYGIDPAKKTMLFVSSFSCLDLPDTEPHGKDEFFMMLQECERKTYRELCSWFEKFVQEHPDIQLVYRYHPAEKSNRTIKRIAEENKNFFAISEFPIGHWLFACDKIYSWCSTSLVEMLMTGKEVYTLRPCPVPELVDMPVYKNAQFIDNYEQFAQSVTEKGHMPTVDEKEVYQWYDIQPVPAYVRLGDWLIETYHDKGYRSRPIRYRPVRSKVREFVKGMPGFVPAAKWFCGHTGENIVSKKLAKMQKEVEYMRYYEEQKKDKNGYIYEKYMANRATEQEIAQRMDVLENLI